jgi:hypothetical protein
MSFLQFLSFVVRNLGLQITVIIQPAVEPAARIRTARTGGTKMGYLQD